MNRKLDDCSDTIIPGTITLEDMNRIWKSGEKYGQEVEASRWQDAWEHAICYGFLACLLLEIAAIALRAGIHDLVAWWNLR